jgi:hypothetical protein
MSKQHEPGSSDHSVGTPWKNTTLSAEKRVENWLTTEGTPHEFWTAAEFDKAGFAVTQGEHQPDHPESREVPHEIDVLASHSVKLDEFDIGHDVIVECKHAMSPWVAFLPMGTTTLSVPAAEMPLETGVLAVARWMSRKQAPAHYVPRVFPQASVAVALKALHDKKESDAAFRALQQMVAIARLRAEANDADGIHHTAVPVIVTDGALCVAKWSQETKSLKIEEVRSCIVDFRLDTLVPRISVQIVTKQGLAAWLTAFRDHLDGRANALHHYVPQVQACVDDVDFKPLGLDKSKPEEAALLARIVDFDDPETRLRALSKY